MSTMSEQLLSQLDALRPDLASGDANVLCDAVEAEARAMGHNSSQISR